MIQQVAHCECGEILEPVSFWVIHNKNERTLVKFMMCDKCRTIEVAKRDLRNWFGGGE